MKYLNNLLQDLGITKVKLAKYLGVSRQMIYNYLTFDSVDKWPKEKKILLMQLLDVNDITEKDIKAIKVDTNYMIQVEQKLNNSLKSSNCNETVIDFKGLNKESKQLLSDITSLLRDKLGEDKTKENLYEVKYLYYFLQSMDNIPEIKYILGYMAKSNGFVKPDVYVFSEEKQFLFEAILYSAFTLYSSGGSSKSKIIERHKRFEQEIEQKKEEILGRTEQLTTTKIQALRELGYSEVNSKNYQEVLEKMAEIESRKI